MEDFKFKIGDFVKMNLPKTEKEYFPSLVYMVVERISHECPGGFQKHYMIRLRSRDGILAEKLTAVNEIELELV